MINFKKIKLYFLLIFVLVNIVYVDPTYSISSREDLFKNALDLSSNGNFSLALKQWNSYLELYPDDAAALSNRGNVKLVIGDKEGSINDQEKAIKLNPDEVDPSSSSARYRAPAPADGQVQEHLHRWHPGPCGRRQWR